MHDLGVLWTENHDNDLQVCVNHKRRPADRAHERRNTADQQRPRSRSVVYSLGVYVGEREQFHGGFGWFFEVNYWCRLLPFTADWCRLVTGKVKRDPLWENFRRHWEVMAGRVGATSTRNVKTAEKRFTIWLPIWPEFWSTKLNFLGSVRFDRVRIPPCWKSSQPRREMGACRWSSKSDMRAAVASCPWEK